MPLPLASSTTASSTTVAVAVAGSGEPVRLRVHPDARMADLVAALGLASATIDGRAVPADRLLRDAGLRHGSTVGGSPLAAAPASEPPVAALAWVAGPDAGQQVLLGPGAWVVGRAPAAHVRAGDQALAPFAAVVTAAAHGELATVRLGPPAARPPAGPNGSPPVVPAGGPAAVDRSPWGTRPVVEATAAVAGDVLALGQGVLLLRESPAPEPVPAAVDGPPLRTVLARPPRAAAPSPVAPPAAPGPAPQAPARPPVPVAAVAAGASTGLAVAVLTGRPLLALVGLTGAAAGLAVALGQRAGAAARHRRATSRWRADVAAHAVALGAAGLAEARRRRLTVPGVVDAVERAAAGSARLWERRPDHDDAFRAVVGLGASSWHGEALAFVPVEVGLGRGAGIGVVGPPQLARGVARSLVLQLCVWHGPADLAVAVTSTDPVAWAWASWLPHASEATSPAGAPAVTLRVLDGDGHGAAVVAGGDAVLAVVSRREALPASCTTVVRVDADGATVERPGAAPATLVAAGLPVARAEASALRLAGFVDPELQSGTELPAAVGLAEVLGGPLDAGTLAARWSVSGGRPAAPVGFGPGGPVELDLDRDGPHALVAGTTGAGKSELLRTLVAALAATCSPDDLTFLLVDFKGGSAFDALAGLPHVVGVVTDLDGDLAARVLRSLEAELRRRERVLRDAGARDLAEHRSRGTGSPLPRLVVVVDELAALVAEQPGFVPALVAVAQRGRALGLHLVLATQRPAGAITDDVRANTALRICLRVADRHESADVVGDPVAAALPADRPGRAALARAGRPVEVVQVASVALDARGPSRPVEVDEVRPAEPAGGDALAALVAAARGAAACLGTAPPRRPWLPALPAVVHPGDVPDGMAMLADDPDGQAQPAASWDPARGHLLVCGSAGSGTSGVLLAVAAAAAATAAPDDLHLYAVDLDGRLEGLRRLPHTGDVVAATDLAGQARLLRRLRAAAGGGRSGAAVVLLVDGLDALRARFDDVAGMPVLDDLAAVLADGPASGVHVAATARRPGALTPATVAAFAERWLLRLAEPDEARAFGVPAAAVASAPPGRLAVAGRSSPAAPASPGAWFAAQAVLVDGDHLGAIAARAGTPSAGARPVGALPSLVGRAGRARRRDEASLLPVGVADADLGPAVLALHLGDPVLVAGPPGSGRTTALALLVEQLREARSDLAVLTVARPGSPARWASDLAVARDDLGGLAGLRDPAVVVVDDAERVEDPGGVLAGLAGRPGVHLLVAGRPEALRVLPWVQPVRRRRTGLLLCPASDDGDLLGVVLPRRRWTPWVPGRAELVQGGRSELVQLAVPRPRRPGRRVA